MRTLRQAHKYPFFLSRFESSEKNVEQSKTEHNGRKMDLSRMSKTIKAEWRDSVPRSDPTPERDPEKLRL
jgi:hypothetical protein